MEIPFVTAGMETPITQETTKERVLNMCYGFESGVLIETFIHAMVSKSTAILAFQEDGGSTAMFLTDTLQVLKVHLRNGGVHGVGSLFSLKGFFTLSSVKSIGAASILDPDYSIKAKKYEQLQEQLKLWHELEVIQCEM